MHDAIPFDGGGRGLVSVRNFRKKPDEVEVSDKPNIDDYIDLFSRYGRDFGSAYLEPEDDRFRFLFDQICRLLAQPSPFNLGLPEPFRTTAHRYLAGDEPTVAHMRVAENRHFMLSDLFDYIHLCQKVGHRDV